MPEIQAVIFDMDGVLVDAKEWHYESLNRALGLFGYAIDRLDHLVTYDGLPTKRKLEMLSIDQGLPRALHDFINEMKQAYTMEMIFTRCKPRFFHEYALANLKARGYRLVVASNSVRPTVELIMEKCHLRGYLDFMLSNQDVTRPKPDPEIYATAIARLGLSPKQCLVVEDNQNGIKAAQTAGAHVMVVTAVEDVNLNAIMAHVRKAEGATA